MSPQTHRRVLWELGVIVAAICAVSYCALIAISFYRHAFNNYQPQTAPYSLRFHEFPDDPTTSNLSSFQEDGDRTTLTTAADGLTNFEDLRKMKRRKRYLRRQIILERQKADDPNIQMSPKDRRKLLHHIRIHTKELISLQRKGTFTGGLLWGTVIDMGTTNRRRPQFLASALANQGFPQPFFDSVDRLPTLSSTFTNPSNASTPEYGTITYDPPKEMGLDEKVNIDVAILRWIDGIRPQLPTTLLFRQEMGLAGSGPLQESKLPVADVMNVQLVSVEPDAFTVTSSDAQEKSLLGGGHAEWHWVVSSHVAGEKHLRLHTQIIRVLSNGQKLPPDDKNNFTATIVIRVLPWYVRFGHEIRSLFKERWKDALTYVLPGGAGATIFATWWAKRRKRRPSDNNPTRVSVRNGRIGRGHRRRP